ncbi:MAG: 30S ribosome-binding factor RbfA [Anaerolineae bacterium]
MATRRQRQVAELLHEEISTLILLKARDPRLKGVTVTGVEVSPDLENAWVYVSVLGTEEQVQEALAGLKSATGFLRREIAAALSLRIVPDLMFRLDDSLERGMRIDRLLDSIAKTTPSTPDAS